MGWGVRGLPQPVGKVKTPHPMRPPHLAAKAPVPGIRVQVLSGIKSPQVCLPCEEMKPEEVSSWMGESIPADSKMESLWSP